MNWTSSTEDDPEFTLKIFSKKGITVIPDVFGGLDVRSFICSSCEKLTYVVIPKGVTSIEEFAFAGCIRLTSVDIPEGVTSIGNVHFVFAKV